MNQFEINEFEHYTDVFKALSDLTRLKMMWLLLSIDSKISVSEIIDVLKVNQYNVSKHLKILKKAGLIYEKREGRWTYYHYKSSTDYFDDIVKQVVLSIPKELMINEVDRCKIRLNLREDEKYATINCGTNCNTVKTKK